jgi:hypothetical protein
MDMAQDNYQLLIQKLDGFIRKYYMNQLIRGVLYSTALILVLFLGLSLLENYYYFHSGTRKLMFWSFVFASGVALATWVFIPLFHYFRLGKIISHEQAAGIIGDHFPDVKDRLLNILQLKNQYDKDSGQELILASINQKTDKIKLVPFQSAIDLSQNRKYLKYTLPPLLLLLLILVVNSSWITEPTFRLLQNNKEFEKPAPFQFIMENENLEVVQFEDYPLTVKVEGDVLPNEVFIDLDNVQYRLNKKDQNTFTYTFSNVQKDIDFNLFSGPVRSTDMELIVLKKPNIANFEVSLDYPAYIGRKDEQLNNIGDLVLPQGTQINWIFQAENTDQILMDFSDEEKTALERRSDELFIFKKRAMKDEAYKLYVSNKNLPNADSISYSLSVVPDQYPTISAEIFKDSTDKRVQYFAGEASDDYGLKSLTFNYRVKREGKEEPEAAQSEKLRINGDKQARFDYTFDMYQLDLKPGDEVTYYFEIWDNDGVNGSKSSRTNLMLFNMPTVEELEKQEQQNNEEIKDKLLDAMKESKKVQDEMKKMREKLLQEKELKWQDKKEMEKLMERQKELQKQIEQAKQQFEENLQNQEEFSKTDEQIMQKQEKLQELFEKSMSEEMQQLMEEIQELMEKMEKDEALEMMEEMQMNDEQLEMELDRMLELFKQLELEHEMQKTIEKLEELAEKQEELSEKTGEENSEEKQEELKKEQEEINKEFEDIQEKMDELEKKNEELERKKDLADTEEEEKSIEEEMEQSQDNLEKQENKKASQNQKKASEKMKEMAQKMSSSMQSGQMEQMQEDMQALRQLLENLVTLSFDQENLIDEFGITEINTPRYVDLTQQQFKLKDDFRLIEDSLQALSKRVFQIESFVTEKVTEIKSNMKSGLDDLEERRKPQAADHQQRVMKNVNDLALMLSETMEQMQQQMSGMMQGNQMCNNPGGQGKSGKVPKDKISQGQKSVNEMMKDMKNQMQNGKGGSSKQFAKMAAQQAAIREALRKKQQELQQRGKGDPKLQEAIDEMNKIETELVNKNLTNEMLKRQEEILSRLLEHEKAEREKDMDEKRQAQTARQYERKPPPSLEEYLKKREAEIDLFKTVSPALKPYYKNLVEEYHKSLKSR